MLLVPTAAAIGVFVSSLLGSSLAISSVELDRGYLPGLLLEIV